MSKNINPYHQWLGIPEKKCPPTFYELLGISLDEEEPAVIMSAAERQKTHVEQFLGTEFNKFAIKLISQIDEGEITLLSPELRRQYDQQVDLFKKRRKKRQFDPHAILSPIERGVGRTVGEESGLVREYAGIVSVLAIAFFGMAAASFWLPWGKLDADKVVVDKQATQEKAPAPEIKVPVPDKEISQPKPIHPPKTTLISVKRIWDKAPTNAFTDLCFFKNNFYCVFREGESRQSATSIVRILKSSDGDIWNPIAQIQVPQIDLRDPKINVTADGKLMLTACGAGINGHQTIATFSRDGQQWTKPVPIGEPNMWLWRPTWNAETLYVVGLTVKKPWLTNLYKSEDGRQMQVLSPDFQKENRPTEAALTFPTPTQAVCIHRKDLGEKTATIGTSVFPFTEWNWEDTGLVIQSPELITLSNGTILLACRLIDTAMETVLFSVDPGQNKFTKLLTLPSSRDQGYPGVVYANGHLWISYYSSHDRNTAVYLAKVKLD